jgi:hypothetical protein
LPRLFIGVQNAKCTDIEADVPEDAGISRRSKNERRE